MISKRLAFILVCLAAQTWAGDDGNNTGLFYTCSDAGINVYDYPFFNETVFTVPADNDSSIMTIEVLSTAEFYYVNYHMIGMHQYSQVYFYGSERKPTMVYQRAAARIYGLSVDEANGNLYMALEGLEEIVVCRMGTLYCHPVVRDAPFLRRLLVIPQRTLLVWSAVDDRVYQGIYLSNSDGSNQTQLTTNEMVNDFAYEAFNDRLYFCDSRTHSVQFYDFGTKSFQAVIENPTSKPFSLVLLPDKIAISDWFTHDVTECDNVRCEPAKRLIEYSGTNLTGGFVTIRFQSDYVPISKFPIVNQCKDNNCSHICLPSSNSSIQCACPYHMELTSNNRTCKTGVKMPYILVTAGKSVYKYFPFAPTDQWDLLDDTLDRPIELMSIGKEFNIGYYSSENKIFKFYPNQPKRHSMLIAEPYYGVIAAIQLSRRSKLFWIDYNKNRLEMADDKTHTLLNGNLTKPISMSIDDDMLTIFIGLYQQPAGSLLSLTLSGRVKRSCTLPSGQPDYLVHDYDLLYFIDSEARSLYLTERMLTQATCRTRFVAHTSPPPYTQIPMSLVIIDFRLLWTNKNSSTIFYVSLHEPKLVVKSVIFNLTDDTHDVRVSQVMH